ncbi:MAG: TetR/AcrR family transcriptional regulator [Pseudomonadota bacterium]
MPGGGATAQKSGEEPHDQTPLLADVPALPRSNGSRTRQLNEDRILRAAEAVFAEAGFNGTTMQAIAEAAKLPKANLHYYFGTKEGLYRALLNRVLDGWVDAFDHFQPDREPADAFTDYVRDKMRFTRQRPMASKVFANEIIHGAQHVSHYLKTKLRDRVDKKAAVIADWIRAGKMAPVDPHHLFFSLWAVTQTYADFDVQVAAVLAKPRLGRGDLDDATNHILMLVLRTCGLSEAPPGARPETRPETRIEHHT